MKSSRLGASMEKEKKKMGRPRKEKKGVAIWIPDIYVDSVRAFLETLKQQNQQAKTS